MYVENRSIDGGGRARKTRRVLPLTAEERTRVGRLLQRHRDNREMNQADIAKTIGCSVGTVQAIEYNKWEVKRERIDQYAAVFGMTAHQLLHPESTIPPADQSIADLNREHLAIARGYMRAIKAVRAAVEVLLAHAESSEDFAEVVLALKRHVEAHPHVGYWVARMLEHGDVLPDLARRLHENPEFEQALLDLLDTEPPKGKTK